MFTSAPPHGNCLAARLCPAAVSLVLALGISSHGMIPLSGGTHAPDTHGVALPRVLWVRVDPLRPHILFASGFGYCHASSSPPGASQICPPWLMRSRDGGATWQDLGGLLPGFTIGQTHLSPPIFTPDGRHLYLPSTCPAVTPAYHRTAVGRVTSFLATRAPAGRGIGACRIIKGESRV